MMQIDECVTEAAIMLDTLAPGWEQKIDVKRLCLRSIDWCVLGQIFRPRWWQIWIGSGYGYLDAIKKNYPHIYTPVFAAPEFHDSWLKELAARGRNPLTSDPVVTAGREPSGAK